VSDYAAFLAEDERTREEIRSRLNETMLVEAGAGTGKTRSLVDRVVSIVQSGTPVESIVAITFTEKAAAELKERVRSALEEQLLKGTGDAALLEVALNSLGRAQISTIHAFCLGLLRTFAPEAGVDPDFEIQDAVLAERRFQDRWRAYLEDLGGEPDAVRVVDRVLSLGLATRDIATLAWELWNLQHLASRLEQQPFVVAGAAWPDLEEMRRGLSRLPLVSVSEEDKLRTAIERVIELVDRLIADPENREALLAGAAPVLSQSFYRGRQGDWGGAARIAQVRDTATAACQALSAALESLRSEALAALVPYLVRFVRQDANARNLEGSLVFDDLIVRVRDLLESSPAVRTAFRERHQVLLIDEFQDTDPLQVDIALSFACTVGSSQIEPGRLFLVGDPKQSIYRFRRADMAIYAATRSRIEKDGGLLPELALNRRSRRVVVEMVNAVFAQLIGEGANPSVQPPYRPIHPDRDEDLAGADVATFGGPESGSAREVRRLEASQVAARCAAVVEDGWQVFDRELQAARPASFRDVAILVPTRAILLPLERALADLDIPYRVEGGSLIYGTQDVRDVINCLTAIDDPADEVAVVAALRSPAYACSDLDLARFRAGGGRFNYLSPALANATGKVADSLRSLKRFHDERHALSLAVVVERLVADHGLVEIGVLDQGNRNSFRRARFLVEQARSFEAHGPESLRAFVAWLERRAGTAILDYEGAGLDDDEDAVRVLTIHGAKGLEFPIVLLAGIGTPPRIDSPVFGIDRSSNQISVAIGAKTHSTRFTLGPADLVEAQERLHADAERDRLLYVAATRARDHLLVSLFHAEKARDSSAQRLIGAGVLDRCEALPLLATARGTRAAPFATLEVNTPPSLEDFRNAHTQLVTDSRRVRYTSATALGRAAGEDEKEERDDMTEPWARGRAGTHVGRAVHAALQSVSWTADAAEIDAIAKAQAVAEAVPERTAEIGALIHRALGSDAAGRARAGRALREVPFALARDGVVVEGFMDLVIDGPDGLEVVDWKTDSVPASEVERRLESYHLQAGLYVAGLEAATRRKVARVTYVFVAPGREVSPGEPAALAEAALAQI
jgi:ATP-dependent helicase/nuclease subunit A